MKVAIVHDWLIGGGAERVVLELHRLYPEAPIYTSYCTPEWRQKLDGKVVTGLLQHWPFSKLRKFIPYLRVWWFSRLNLKQYDLVISSSGAEAKGVRVTKPTVHINYCHAPTHYYWSRYDDYLKNPGFGLADPLARLGLKLLVEPLRHRDYKAAQGPDFLIANSQYTKQQIKKYYGREATVIHPPVEVERFAGTSDEPRRGFITTGRQTPYKRIDLAVEACTKLDLPLVVLGSGPQNAKLQKMAGNSVTFLRGKTDEEVANYFKSSLAFIFPGLDDFGIVAVEALAAGTPVIAYGAGGALDYVQENKNGLFFEPQTTEALEKTLQRFKPEDFNPEAIAKTAQPFNAEHFRTNIQSFIKQKLAVKS
jgi:glycosyltransferase involved in cell wall biosynthesis